MSRRKYFYYYYHLWHRWSTYGVYKLFASKGIQSVYWIPNLSITCGYSTHFLSAFDEGVRYRWGICTINLKWKYVVPMHALCAWKGPHMASRRLGGWDLSLLSWFFPIPCCGSQTSYGGVWAYSFPFPVQEVKTKSSNLISSIIYILQPKKYIP